MAKKAWQLFTTLRERKSFSATFGALDTVQVIQMAKYLTTIYVSGWQSSSTASSTNEVRPSSAYVGTPNPNNLFLARSRFGRLPHEYCAQQSRPAVQGASVP
jgi:isocitrate lyase